MSDDHFFSKDSDGVEYHYFKSSPAGPKKTTKLELYLGEHTLADQMEYEIPMERPVPASPAAIGKTDYKGKQEDLMRLLDSMARAGNIPEIQNCEIPSPTELACYANQHYTVNGKDFKTNSARTALLRSRQK